MRYLTANDRPGIYPESWYTATAVGTRDRPALDGEHTCDVCIVGGGYTGLSTALRLAERGHDVVLLEAHRAGWGASGRNGGQVCTGHRQDQDVLEAALGREDALALWRIAEAAKQTVRDLIEHHGIGCDYRPGIAWAVVRPDEVAPSHHYAAHLAGAYGYTRIEPLDREGMRARIGSAAYHGGYIDWGAGHLHPLNLALGIARAADDAGAKIFERSTVTRIVPGDPVRVETATGSVRASHLVLACNGYLDDLEPRLADRMMPINNYVLATEPLGERADSVIKGGFAVADSKFVINYYRLSPDGRLLFGGGESYGARFPADLKAFVRRPMLRVFPHLADVRIDYAWGGTLAIARRRLPIFARLGPNVLTASGYSGQGVALGVHAGTVLADTIEGTTADFDMLGKLPQARFPGGRWLRAPLQRLVMSWFALRDRL